MGPEAAALEVVAAVAEPAVDETDELAVGPPVDMADEPEEVDAPGPRALAFNLPQTKEWQKA